MRKLVINQESCIGCPFFDKQYLYQGTAICAYPVNQIHRGANSPEDLFVGCTLPEIPNSLDFVLEENKALPVLKKCCKCGKSYLGKQCRTCKFRSFGKDK